MSRRTVPRSRKTFRQFHAAPLQIERLDVRHRLPSNPFVRNIEQMRLHIKIFQNNPILPRHRALRKIALEQELARIFATAKSLGIAFKNSTGRRIQNFEFDDIDRNVLRKCDHKRFRSERCVTQMAIMNFSSHVLRITFFIQTRSEK